jgi:hypothetical protein
LGTGAFERSRLGVEGTRSKRLLARWRVRCRVKGKAGPSVRPDNSQIRGYRSSRPGVPAQLAAADDDGGPGARAARLGVALAGLGQELVAARREVALLERENAALRSRLMVGARGE